jgi:hypothetical protein
MRCALVIAWRWYIDGADQQVGGGFEGKKRRGEGGNSSAVTASIDVCNTSVADKYIYEFFTH